MDILLHESNGCFTNDVVRLGKFDTICFEWLLVVDMGT